MSNIVTIWAEGYLATGMEGIPARAMKLGAIEATTLREACEKMAKDNPEFKRLWCPDRMTYWGCRLFDNETDARRFLG